MDPIVPIKLEINLQKISMNVVALQLWERHKKQIHEVFKKSFFFVLKNFDSITEEVLKQLDVVSLPENVLVELRDIIRFMGEKIICWTYRVKSELGLDVKYAKNISWTWYGTINEAKTFQLYLQNDSELLAHQINPNEHSSFVHSIYSIACLFGQEMFVSKNLNLMKEMIKNYFGTGLEIPNEHSVITKWLCFYIVKNKDQACNLYLDHKLHAKLFSMCAAAGYLNAVKYLSNHLTADRDIIFFSSATKTLKEFKDKKCLSLRDNYIEILIFLINEMSLEMQILFLRQNLSGLFEVLVDVWPWQELFLQILNYTSPFMAEEDKEKLLISVLQYFYKQENYKEKTNRNVPRRVLQKMLGLTSKEVKKKNIVEWGHFFYKLIYLSDYATLKIILNDSDVTRDDVIKTGVDEVLKLSALSGKSDPLIEFIRQILTNEDKAIFKNDFRILKSLLTDGNFELSENFLDWLAETPEEKSKLKGQIDSVDILVSLYERNKFSLPIADRLLNWQFDKDLDLIKKVKDVLKTEDFIRTEFYKIWGANCAFSVESSKTKCTEFLNFFFEPYEIENFKRKLVIKDEDFVKIFFDHLPGPEKFDTVDEFLNFCGLSQDKVDEIKGKILECIEDWVVFFVIEKKSFKIARALINWVVQDEENKNSLVLRFIKPAESAEKYREMLNKNNRYSLFF